MIDRRIPYTTFQKIPALRNLNESECHQLLEIAKEKSFTPDEAIVVQGEESQNLWIVLEGKCQVVKGTTCDGPVVLAELEPYQLFGEMSFFSPAPHSANVVAKTSVRLLSIARSDYDDLIRDGVTVAYKLAYNIIEHVAARLRRMDDWVAELSCQEPAIAEEAKTPEWREFRDKLFNGWNL